MYSAYLGLNNQYKIMNKINRIDLSRLNTQWRILLSSALLLNTTACSTKEEVIAPTPDPTILELKLKAGKLLNPDIEGRASPLVVRIYQFEAIDKFNTSDFFAIYDNDVALLGQDIIFRKELELQPDTNRNLSLESKPEAHYLAIFAAFRNLDTAQWKTSMKIVPNQTNKVTLNFDQYTVTLNTKTAD
ncbi:MAG: type VI secretion system lipoprotein TssJ [Gammaproteobacteria bacterium HGW-Gammaproteobacteria-10]|nr:MAG: type VI secretion system lipoprotein TssJ [Gammaproteobacteria bacterium HGW-Gammaproteobacteria-10]